MKMSYVLLLTLSLTILLAGCQQNDITPPPSSFNDRSMTDYSFVDISDACTTHHNVNLSENETYCTAPQKEAFMYYSEEHNWSVMCCDYTSQCTNDYDINYTNVCPGANDGKYNGYVYNDDGFWLAQCCNEQGGGCYVDTSITVNDSSTVCDEDYHQNTYGLNHNGTEWDAMCCVGGLEE